MARVASYDVFDTVLTRLCGSPRQVFVAAGRALAEAGVTTVAPEAYAASRQAAADDLTADVARHPALADVATVLAARLGLAPECAADLVAAEEQVESDTLRAVPGAVEALERARARTGRGVALVSDTSLPHATLAAILTREGLLRDGDRLWTSAAAGASKQDGGLFDVVAADLGVDPGSIEHTGDDAEADLAHAVRHGWGARPDTRARLTGRERRLDEAGPATGGTGPRLAGAARMARLRARADGADVDVATVAGSVAAPVLVGFTTWVLERARALGVDRLYFVARDGEVFRDVAAQLLEGGVAGPGPAPELRYLHGSRRAWQLAATGVAGYDRARDLWVPDDLDPADLTAAAALALVALSPADARAVVDDPDVRALLDPAHTDRPLGADGWARLLAAVSAGPLAAELDRRARTQRDLLLEYLDAQGVTAPGTVALVDVGWTGRMARALEEVLADGGRPRPAAHLYLGVLDPARTVLPADLAARTHGWLVDEPRGVRRRTRPDEDPVMLVETLAMGREGQTTGYARAGDDVVPVLTHPVNPSTGRWAFADYRAALGHAVDALLDGPPLPAGVDLRPLAWAVLLDLWRHPTAGEARAWGAQPYGEDFANEHAHPLATSVGTRRALTRLGVGRPEWREPTYWLAGTLAVSPPPWRQLLTAADRAAREAPRMRRLPRRVRDTWVRRRHGG